MTLEDSSRNDFTLQTDSLFKTRDLAISPMIVSDYSKVQYSFSIFMSK